MFCKLKKACNRLSVNITPDNIKTRNFSSDERLLKSIPLILVYLISNVIGTIEIKKNSFSSQLSNVFEIEGKKYVINFKNRVECIEEKQGIESIVYDGNTYTSSEKNESVFVSNDNDSCILLKISSETNNAYYLGQELKSDVGE